MSQASADNGQPLVAISNFEKAVINKRVVPSVELSVHKPAAIQTSTDVRSEQLKNKSKVQTRTAPIV